LAGGGEFCVFKTGIPGGPDAYHAIIYTERHPWTMNAIETESAHRVRVSGFMNFFFNKPFFSKKHKFWDAANGK